MAALDQSKPDQLVRRWPSLRSLVLVAAAQVELVAAVQLRVEQAMLVWAVVPGVPPLRPADSTGRALWKSPPRSDADSEFRRSTQRGLYLEGLLQRGQISKFFR
jgi:hypothetical protein